MSPSNATPISRRDVFVAGGAIGASVCVAAGLGSAAAGDSPAPEGGAVSPLITRRRKLGTGNHALEVSALGFGCMGMNYHRGPHPGRAAMIGLARQAAESGVTLFDTAEVYGPYTNEELVREALTPPRGKVTITTKFGWKIDPKAASRSAWTAGRDTGRAGLPAR